MIPASATTAPPSCPNRLKSWQPIWRIGVPRSMLPCPRRTSRGRLMPRTNRKHGALAEQTQTSKNMIAKRFTVCVAMLALVCLACPLALSAAAPRPNIVFVLADDLGSYDVSWRGSEIKTPNLDRLARAGATLEQFYVQPVCSPTPAALMTGRYPCRYGLQVGVVRPWAQYGLSLDERTLPQALHDAGYQTAITGKWHLGHYRPEYLPTRRGFDHQYGHYNGAIDYFTH